MLCYRRGPHHEITLLVSKIPSYPLETGMGHVVLQGFKAKLLWKKNRHSQQCACNSKLDAGEGGEKLSHGCSQMLTGPRQCFSALRFNWEPDASQPTQQALNKHSLLPIGTAHTGTNHPHLWPGEVPVTHTETPDKGQNITTASQKRDRLSAYGGFFFFYHVGSTCTLGSVAKSCSTLCDSTECSAPGFPVLHYLPEFAQTHVHWVSHAIQPSHLLSPPSPPAFNLSHGVFSNESVLRICGQSIRASALVLPMNTESWFALG